MQRRKDSGATGDDSNEFASRRSSVDSLRSPTTSHHHGQQQTRNSQLSDVAENNAFAIGDDDDEEDSDDDEPRPTPSQSSLSENPSRASSVVSVEDAVPTQMRGMSEKARGKMPAGSGPLNFSRQNSTTSLGSGSAHGGLTGSSSSDNLAGSGRFDGPGGSGSAGGLGGNGFEPTAQWIDSWLPELPLHTILAVIQQISALIPRDKLAVEYPSPDTLQRIQDVHLAGIEPSTIRVHSFEWSALSLGWYESMLWSFIVSSEMQVAKGTVVGVWNSTAIKLFRVQEAAAQGPSLTSPRGAVDAVGSNIVSRIGQINLRGNNAAGVALGPATGGAGGATNNAAGSSPGGGNPPTPSA